MFHESMRDMDELPAYSDKDQAHNLQQHMSLMTSSNAGTLNGYDIIKKELDQIQLSHGNSLFELNVLVSEKNDIEKKYQDSREKANLLFLEMSKHREIADRLEALIFAILQYLPEDERRKISDAVYRAKHFSPDDMIRLADNQTDCASINSGNFLLGQNMERQQITNNNEQQAPVNDLLLMAKLGAVFVSSIIAGSKSSSTVASNVEQATNNPADKPKAPNTSSPHTISKPPVPKRKRTVKFKSQPQKGKASIQQPKQSPQIKSEKKKSKSTVRPPFYTEDSHQSETPFPPQKVSRQPRVISDY